MLLPLSTQLVPWVQLALAFWSTLWLISLFLCSPSSSVLTPQQRALLGLQQQPSESSSSVHAGSSQDTTSSSSITVEKKIATGAALTGTSRRPPEVMKAELTRKQLEAAKPSAHSNFLLSAVTSPGRDRQHRLSDSSSPRLVNSCDLRGHQHVTPHLHNHVSCAFNSPSRQGENLASITGETLYPFTSPL